MVGADCIIPEDGAGGECPRILKILNGLHSSGLLDQGTRSTSGRAWEEQTHNGPTSDDVLTDLTRGEVFTVFIVVCKMDGRGPVCGRATSGRASGELPLVHIPPLTEIFSSFSGT